MTGRRQFIVGVAAACGVAPVAWWLAARPDPHLSASTRFPVAKSEETWRTLLSSEQYRVLRERGTERPFSSALNRESRAGVFACAACSNPLFSSSTKFDSGTGWPSFWAPLDDAVETSVDTSWLMVRTEVHCAQCGSHLGHLFPDGPKPTGLRYCINGVALIFRPDVSSRGAQPMSPGEDTPVSSLFGSKEGRRHA